MPAPVHHIHTQGETRSLQPSTSTKAPGARVINRAMVLAAIEKQGVRIPRHDVDAEDKALAKQTHLHLNNHRITKIANLRGLSRLETLYLYDNRISVIEGVSHLDNLTHLYLQNNMIQDITGLSGMRNLQKLYLQVGKGRGQMSGVPVRKRAEHCPCIHINRQVFHVMHACEAHIHVIAAAHGVHSMVAAKRSYRNQAPAGIPGSTLVHAQPMHGQSSAYPVCITYSGTVPNY